jgi:transcriptional regulator with XRE-family HTH domain
MSGQDIKTAFGKNIKNLRAHRQYSQADLAERADISITFLSNIERGLKFPKPEILSKIAESLDVEIFELFKTNHIPNALPIDNKKLINRISKVMAKKVLQTMDGVFSNYLK